MSFKTVDILVILGYLAIITSIGFILRKRSSQSKKDYLLGGNKLPWWMLGISNASGMFDISGTIWMVSIMFIYGVKSVWLPWLWPVFKGPLKKSPYFRSADFQRIVKSDYE